MRSRHLDVIMAVGDADESKKKSLRPEKKSAWSYYELWPFGRLHTS